MKIASSLITVFLFATAVCAQEETVLVVQGSGGQARTATAGYYYQSGYTPQYMLALQQVQEELDLSKGQLKQIAEVRASSTKHTQEIYKEMQQVAPEKRGEFYREMIEVHRQNMEKEFTGILLAHQKKRLDQIQYQLQVKTQGTYALQNPQLAKVLGITDEQIQQMRQKALEENRKLAAEYQRMRRESQDKILEDVLTKEQKKRLEELSGKSFELKPVNRNFRVLGNSGGNTREPDKK